MDTKLKISVGLICAASIILIGSNTTVTNEMTVESITYSAQKEDPTALYMLGLLHLDGTSKDIQKNPEKALQLFEKAAEKGHPVAAYHAGLIHQDPSRKEYFWLKAINLGHLDAMLDLAKLNIQQERTQEGMSWLKTANENGDTNATFMLAHLLFEGAGVEQDKVKGILLLKKVLAHGKNENINQKIEYMLPKWISALTPGEKSQLDQAPVDDVIQPK